MIALNWGNILVSNALGTQKDAHFCFNLLLTFSEPWPCLYDTRMPDCSRIWKYAIHGLTEKS